MNCQLGSSWHLGKCEPGIVPDREGLVEAAGDSIKVEGVRVPGGGGVTAGEGPGTTVINHPYESFGCEPVRVGNRSSSNVEDGGGHVLRGGMGETVGSDSEEASTDLGEASGKCRSMVQRGPEGSWSTTGGRGLRGPPDPLRSILIPTFSNFDKNVDPGGSGWTRRTRGTITPLGTPGLVFTFC